MTEESFLPPSPWGQPSVSVRPWAGNHLKACKDHNHSGLCPIKEQYALDTTKRQPAQTSKK